jgi:hypothetical protein
MRQGGTAFPSLAPCKGPPRSKGFPSIAPWREAENERLLPAYLLGADATLADAEVASLLCVRACLEVKVHKTITGARVVTFLSGHLSAETIRQEVQASSPKPTVEVGEVRVSTADDGGMAGLTCSAPT